MKINNLNERLISVERSIVVYKKNIHNSPIEEIKIDIDVNKLKRIISVKHDAPLMYDGL